MVTCGSQNNIQIELWPLIKQIFSAVLNYKHISLLRVFFYSACKVPQIPVDSASEVHLMQLPDSVATKVDCSRIWRRVVSLM